MTGAADLNNSVFFDPALFGSAFVLGARSCRNAQKMRRPNLFSFCPMNGRAFSDKTSVGVESLDAILGDGFALPIRRRKLQGTRVQFLKFLRSFGSAMIDHDSEDDASRGRLSSFFLRRSS